MTIANLSEKLSTIQHLPKVLEWVKEQIQILQPSDVYVCTGTQQEYDDAANQLIKKGSFLKLSETKRPNSYLARSDPRDVARVEANTYICSKLESDCGPTNHWMDPNEMKSTLKPLLTGSMFGRTMYVIPFCMGPLGSPLSRIGFELSDSAYVVVNMKIMTRMGSPVIELLKADDDFVKGVHTVGYPLVDGKEDVAWPCNTTKYIVHYPEEQTICSYGSGYGGNALLGKKCFALRIASNLGRKEGWLAEHMLIVGATNPQGEKKYLCAAFPSACGKTNMAMMEPALPGWKIETVGDDIAWLRPGDDGRLWAINPENGFFGVAPGTNFDTNPNAMKSMAKDTIFTNVALTDDGDVWWEGMTKEAPSHLIDWKGNDWTPSSTEKAAHPNSRFTSSLSLCPTRDSEWNSATGVPIDAILFGGRRKKNVPLVVESLNWTHSTYMGATVSSAQTAAAEGVVGALRHDPFAMLPFCGYHMGDYFNHWLSMENLVSNLPKVFMVNWFRLSEEGKFLWPGFGENIRVVDWILKRVNGSVESVETPIGRVPQKETMNLPEGFSDEQFEELFRIDPIAWKEELAEAGRYFERMGDKLPKGITTQMEDIKARLEKVASTVECR